jgi:hypothetical protein
VEQHNSFELACLDAPWQKPSIFLLQNTSPGWMLPIAILLVDVDMDKSDVAAGCSES